MRRAISTFIAILVCMLPISAMAGGTVNTTINQSPTCPNANIWGAGLISDICWSCMFPFRVFGVGGDSGRDPDGRANDIVCSCVENGLPSFGFPIGMWTPAYLVEVVRQPYCSPALGGITLVDDVSGFGGSSGPQPSPEEDYAITQRGNFYQYHTFAFPLFAILDLLLQKECQSDGYFEFDMMFVSELDPTWIDPEVGMFTAQESVMFATPIAMAACAIDCSISSTMDKPSDNFYWCAGCWGQLYPFTGHFSHEGSAPRDSSLITARALALQHRRGMARRTYGSGNLCGGEVFPMLPKQQYKFSQRYPVPEANSPCCHNIGESSFNWGEWRNIPAVGEDFVHIVWRYTDCCMH